VFVVHLFLDIRLWGTSATPGVVLIGGYVIAIGIYAATLLFYSGEILSPWVYFLLVIFGILSMLVSGLCSTLFSVRHHMLQSLFSKNNNRQTPVLIISIILYTLVALPRVFKSVLWSSEILIDNAFSGILGHLHIWLSFVVIWYASTSDERGLRKGIMYITSILLLSLYPVKGWILITAFAIILVEAQKRNKGKISLGSLIIGGATGALLFFAIYLSRQLPVGFSLNDFIDQVYWIFGHFLLYLTTGIFGLNAVVNGLTFNGGLEVIFAPFLNLYSFLSGEDYFHIVNNMYIEGFWDLGVGGNVYSMLGTLVGYLGYLGGISIALFLLWVNYSLLGLSLRMRSAALYSLSLYYTAIFTFGWFEYYFWHLRPYEVFIFSLLALIFEAQFKRRTNSSTI
jgi:hypothetical protein